MEIFRIIKHEIRADYSDFVELDGWKYLGL